MVNVYKAQKEKPLPLPASDEEECMPKEWKMSKDFKQLSIRARRSTVKDLLGWTTLANRAANGACLTPGETDMRAQVNHVCGPELYADKAPTSG